MADELSIPAGLLPVDGRFGSGPSKVRAEAVAALAASGTSLLGTSHRQAPVKALVRRLLDGLRTFFDLPDDYVIALGNGGTTAFWDIATCCLIRERSQQLAFGEFSAKFATAVAAAPFLTPPSVLRSKPGTRPLPQAEAGIDTYAWAHNETSTGVMAPVQRVPGADAGALLLVDATSGAGGLPVDVREVDAYYFAPQKAFGSDGGLWLALLSPAAVQRAHEVAIGNRWIPPFLDLRTAVDNAAIDQTYNTPAIATLFLMAEQVDWFNEQGGMDWTVGRTSDSSSRLYGWADATGYASSFVRDVADRSLVVATIDFDEGIDALQLAAVLRSNGIVDVEPYRKLGRNQLRIAMFPAIDPADIEALTGCIDYVVARLR